ncbi:hypothetical protein JCM10207_001045 [Rhodosporidiobolus poonsookiae]
MSAPIASTSSWRDASNPPVTPVRFTLPLCSIPENACPKRTSRKRAPPSPLDATFSAQRREHLFTLSTACNRRLLSPSTPTAPLLPAAPIFMPLPPTPSTAKTASGSYPSSSPMKRSPGIRNLCRFTADAFREDRERSLSASSEEMDDTDVDEERWAPRALGANSLGLFDFYREPAAPMSLPSSPELAGSSSDDDCGRWSDAHDEDDDASVVFARRISFDSATPSPQSFDAGLGAFRTIPLPDIASLPVTERTPLGTSPFLSETYDAPSSPVPSLSYSTSSFSSPASSLASLSSAPSSPPSTPSPSPMSRCISTFASTSFFSAPSPLLSGSSLAQRRLESLDKRRADKEREAVVASDGAFFGLGLSA